GNVRPGPTCAAVQGVPRVALERRREAGPDQASARHGPLAVASPERVGRLDRRALLRVVSREHAELLALAQVRRSHAEQADPPAADLGPGELGGGPANRLAQSGGGGD